MLILVLKRDINEIENIESAEHNRKEGETHPSAFVLATTF